MPTSTEQDPPPDTAFTVDRVEIVDGLRVFTNNLDTGVVDLSRQRWQWYPSEQRHHLWFDVLVDTDYGGNPISPPRPVMQSDDRVTTRFQGTPA